MENWLLPEQKSVVACDETQEMNLNSTPAV